MMKALLLKRGAKKQNNDYGKDTRPLRVFKRVTAFFFVELFDFFRQQAYNSNATSGSSDQTFEVYSHLTGNSLLPVTFLAYFSRGVPFPYPTY